MLMYTIEKRLRALDAKVTAERVNRGKWTVTVTVPDPAGGRRGMHGDGTSLKAAIESALESVGQMVAREPLRHGRF